MQSHPESNGAASASPDGRARTPQGGHTDGAAGGREAGAANPSSLINEFAALSEFALHMASARLDELRLHIRRRLESVVVHTIAGIAVLACVAAFAFLSAAYVLQGAAGALAEMLGGRAWAGRLVVGIVGVGFLLGGAYWRNRALKRASLKKRTMKYELRKARQRARFGRDTERPAE